MGSTIVRCSLSALSMVVMLLGMVAHASAQGMYYQEVEKEGRVYVFNLAADYERWVQSGEIARPITRAGYGPRGETVVFDSEAAIMLYNFRHGRPAENLTPPPPAAPPPAAATASAAPPWRISGYMIGDYYGFPDHHDPRFDGQQGFWFRRVYLTYDHELHARFATRLRLEMNSSGDLASTSLTPYVKDAYLRWTFAGQQQVWFGIFPTPTFEFIEGFWGLRHIEKTPADLYRTDSSRDFGAGLQGPINESRTLRYAFQYGNDSSTNSEVDESKATRIAVRYETDPGLVAEGFYGYYGRPGETDRQMYQGFVGYRRPRVRTGFQYYRNTREVPGGADLELDLYSGFGVIDVVPEKWSVFARVDRFDDPNPAGGDIDYLPIDPRARYTFFLGGVEYYLHKSVRISPNVETVTYGDLPDGTSISTDVAVRLTLYWTW